MRLRRIHLKLRTKIALLSFSLVLLSVLLAGVVIVGRTTTAVEQEIGMRAMAIARTVAQHKDVQENLGKIGGEKIIQPIAERIRLATGVEYIVLFDMERRRYSHPLEERIGTTFNDGDEGPSLRKQEYLSQATGILGPSIRAFVPVMTDEGTRQVGVTVVGILTPTLQESLQALRFQLYSSLLAGVVFGILGSFYLAHNIKKNLFSLEPPEIARILKERTAIFQSLGEGVIAIDREGRITIENNEAKRLTGRATNQEGGLLQDENMLSVLKEVMARDETRYNKEFVLHQTLVLANFLPIKVKDKVIGAVMTFQDKTEVNKMAEELTGVKSFIEGLRAQNHEYLNKLHTIAGLIQLGKRQTAIDYIFAVTEEQQEVTQFLSRRIRHPALAGLLMGKYNRAKELKVNLIFDSASHVSELPETFDSGVLIIIVGNLLENALEAVIDRPLQEVHCFIQQTVHELRISIEDTGPGIPSNLQQKIFDWGFTTKGLDNHGLGLHLVQQAIERTGGMLDVESGDWGTRFFIRLPLPHRADERARLQEF